MLAPQRIAPGVYRIAILLANAYVVEIDGGVALIDCLMPGDTSLMLNSVKTVVGDAAALKAIWLTHGDIDHVGSLAELKERTGVPVAAHPLVAPFARCETIRQFRSPLMQAVSRRMFPTGPLRPSQVDRFFEIGETVSGWQIIDTPGHAPGHIAFYHGDKRILIGGDTMMNLGGLRPSFGPFTDDPALNAASIRQLAQLDVAVAGFGHGAAITQQAGEKIRRVARNV